MELLILVIAVPAVVCWIAGGIIAYNKGRSPAGGGLLGLLLGVIGLLIVLSWRTNEQELRRRRLPLSTRR